MVLSPLHRSLIREIETADAVREILQKHPGARVSHKVQEHQEQVLSELESLESAISERPTKQQPDSVSGISIAQSQDSHHFGFVNF